MVTVLAVESPRPQPWRKDACHPRYGSTEAPFHEHKDSNVKYTTVFPQVVSHSAAIQDANIPSSHQSKHWYLIHSSHLMTEIHLLFNFFIIVYSVSTKKVCQKER